MYVHRQFIIFLLITCIINRKLKQNWSDPSSNLFMNFINKRQEIKLKEWTIIQNKKVARLQGQRFAFYGSIGGGYKYEFIPTSIGTVILVTNTITGDQIDLTEYHKW